MVSRMENMEKQAINTAAEHNAENADAQRAKGFFGRLAAGDYGLAKTYWIFGVLVGFVFNAIVAPVKSIELILVIMIVHGLYFIFVMKGIWRAADRYQGWKGWAVLAKVAVILGAIMLILGIVGLIGFLL